MLTKELAIREFVGDQIKPDCLTRKAHSHYVDYAKQMLQVYGDGVGKTRHQLHMAIRQILADEPSCPPRRMDAFCKLLDDQSAYDTDHRGKAAALRCKVLQLAAPYHPLVEQKDRLFEHTESEVKRNITEELGRSNWSEIEAEMFADVFEYNQLKSFTGYSGPEALLSRYNVAQVQVALFDATRLVIRARADFQRIITHVKLARLLHDIRPAADNATSGEYIISLDGPASVLRETRRYGVNMAKFLPALLSCRDWDLEAEVSMRFIRFRRRFHFTLSSNGGLKSEMPPQDEFDSSVEEGFAKRWGTEKRRGWAMKRGGVILHRRQTAFLPDFLFQHEDGRKVMLEIVGFWTPEYLQGKFEKLKLFQDEPIVLAVSEHATNRFLDNGRNIIRYKTVLKLNDVLTALDRTLPS